MDDFFDKKDRSRKDKSSRDNEISKDFDTFSSLKDKAGDQINKLKETTRSNNKAKANEDIVIGKSKTTKHTDQNIRTQKMDKTAIKFDISVQNKSEKRELGISNVNSFYKSENDKLTLFFKGDDLAILGKIPKILNKFESKTIDRENITRFYPRDYFSIIAELKHNSINFNSTITVKRKLPDDCHFERTYKLYSFQKEAVDAWIENNYQGTVLIPTGGGKTIIALDIIKQMGLNTLVVVPTLVLFQQWKNKIVKYLGIDEEYVGFYGGGDKEINPITIITYDSARLYVKQLRDKYGLLILDEAHHLSDKSSEIIADGYLADCRLALTATLSKDSQVFNLLMQKGFSPVVYSTTPHKLVKKSIISDFEITTIEVDIEDKDEYDYNIDVLQNYIKSKRLYGDVFQQIIYRVNRDKEAEQALNAYRKARKIAFTADKKLMVLHNLLEKHNNDKIIIFSDVVSFCERIAREFFIPCMTNRTPKIEREKIMSFFNNIDDAKLVSSKILDEGVDIKDAAVGIIVSGTSTTRQFIQRLGRILRIHPDKNKAKLYEIVSSETMETTASTKRKRGINN